MLLMSVQQGFSPGHVIGELICIDEGFHLSHPAGEVAEVSKEALKPKENQEGPLDVPCSQWRAQDGKCLPKASDSMSSEV